MTTFDTAPTPKPTHAGSATLPETAPDATEAPLALEAPGEPTHTLPAPEATGELLDPPPAPATADAAAQPTLPPQVLRAAEALLFVAAEPVEAAQLLKALELTPADEPLLLEALRSYFAERGLRVQVLERRLQLVSAPEAAPVIERFLGAPTAQRLSPAALEVLAIIAYRQPLTRAQVEAIRGVDSSGVIRSLLLRELIAEAGRAEALGRPILYATTPLFLQVFGLTSLDELPPMELPQPPQP